MTASMPNLGQAASQDETGPLPDLTLHGMGQSGNAYKVALALRLMKLPHRLQFVDFFNGATRDAGWRAEVNTMGEVPVLVLAADPATGRPERRLSQSGAILHWLADRTGLLAGQDEWGRHEVLRWILFDNHKFTAYFATYRYMKSFAPNPPDPTVMAFLRARVEASFGIVERHLQDTPWVAGAQPTIADCSLAGYVYYPAEESGIDLPAQYPAIGAWMRRLQQLDGWAGPYDALPGERIAPRW